MSYFRYCFCFVSLKENCANSQFFFPDQVSTWLDARTYWIASEIVSEPNAQRRVDVLSHFLSVSEVKTSFFSEFLFYF